MTFIPSSGGKALSYAFLLAAALGLLAVAPAAAQIPGPGAQLRQLQEPTKSLLPRRSAPRRNVELPRGTVVEYDVRTKIEVSPPSPSPLSGTGLTKLDGRAPIRPTDLGDVDTHNETREALRRVTPTVPREVTDLYNTPRETVAKLESRFPDGSKEECSGFMMGEYHVWTAAHCVFQSEHGGWVTETKVILSQNDQYDPKNEAEHPYGYAYTTYQRMYKEYRQDESQDDFDFAILTLDRRVGRWTGWMGANSNVADALNLSGYPVEAPVPSTAVRQYLGFDPNNVRDTTSTVIELDAYIIGGMSGGPVWHSNGGRPIVQGINTSAKGDNDAIGYAARTRSYFFDDYARFIREDEARRPPEAIAELIENTMVKGARALLTPTAEPGGTIRVRYNAVNAGTAPADNVVLDFYISKSGWDLTGGRRIASRSLGTIPGEGIVGREGTFTVPLDMAAGNYRVGWTMRTSSAEYAEDNNTAVIYEQLLTIRAGAELSVAVTDTFLSSGPKGGPFSPSKKNYVVHNKGSSQLSFAVFAGRKWLYVSPSKGTIAPGGNATVTVSIDRYSADKASVGTHESIITFINQTNGVGDTTRPAVLTVLPATFNLLLSTRPAGAGTVTGAGTFPNGSTQTVTAVANAGWLFDTWVDERGRFVSNEAAYTFVLTRDTVLRANFVVPYQISLLADPEDGGTVTGAGPVKPGVVHTVKAKPSPGATFEHWTEGGDIVSTSRTYKFTVESSRTLTAHFSTESKNDLLVDFGTQGVWAYFDNDPQSWIRIWGGAQTAAKIEAADLNGDEKDELVLLTPYDPNGPSGGALFKVHPVTQAETYLDNPVVALTFATGDLDGDGNDDLFARVTGAEAIFMKRINNGAWTDVNVADPPMVDGLLAADLDGNGKADIVAFGNGAGVLVRYNDAGNFTSIVPGAYNIAAAGDLDGNGQADIAFAKSDRVLLYRNNKNLVSTTTSSGGATRLHFADADGDGSDELYKLMADGVWRMNANLSFTQVLQSQSANSITALGSADLDGNGKQDLLVQQNGEVLVRMNNAGQFARLFDFQVGASAKAFAAGRLN